MGPKKRDHATELPATWAPKSAGRHPELLKTADYHLIRLRSFTIKDVGDHSYAELLVEYIDKSVRGFSVVDFLNFDGREISGTDSERGGYTAHVVVRLPSTGAHDDGSYRCAIEAGTPISRKDIETFMRRQLRRRASLENWTYQVKRQNKKGKVETKDLRYHARLDLLSDVSRAFNPLGSGAKVLTHLVFTKRAEKQSAGRKNEVSYQEFEADVELRVSASQGPSDPEERKNWLLRLMSTYREEGYNTRTLFRGSKGTVIGGSVHRSVEAASDLFLCPREIIDLDAPPALWVKEPRADVVAKMRELVDRDELWHGR